MKSKPNNIREGTISGMNPDQIKKVDTESTNPVITVIPPKEIRNRV